MFININDIKINPGRREAAPEDVKKLSESIAQVGMMNPITVDADHNLVAGLHRLEAAKLLGWSEIECTVCELDELHAELAEIDENVVRTGLSDLELSDLLARRKKIYETLHPETRHGGDRCSVESKTTNCRDASVKSFAEDTADKMGVSPRTIERHVQIAENLTEEAKDILRGAEKKITKQNLTKLSRLEPKQQGTVARLLATGVIDSVDEYQPLETKTPKQVHHADEAFPANSYDGPSLSQIIADLKDPNKDCSCTPDSFTNEAIYNLHKITEELKWNDAPYYQVVFSELSQEQLDLIQNEINAVHAALDEFIGRVKDAGTQKEEN